MLVDCAASSVLRVVRLWSENFSECIGYVQLSLYLERISIALPAENGLRRGTL